jgi:hypothetical protein
MVITGIFASAEDARSADPEGGTIQIRNCKGEWSSCTC